MSNPLEQIVALAKKGDRRVLIGGAAAIGGGVGLVVFLAKRKKDSTGGSSTTFSTDTATNSGEALPPEGGGGDGGSTSSLFGDMAGGPGLPELPPSLPDAAINDMAPAPLPLLPDLSSLLASPYLPIAQPPAFDFPPLPGGIDNLAPLVPVSGGMAISPTTAIPSGGSLIQKTSGGSLGEQLLQRNREIQAEPLTRQTVTSSREIQAEPLTRQTVTTGREIQAEPLRFDQLYTPARLPGGGQLLPSTALVQARTQEQLNRALELYRAQEQQYVQSLQARAIAEYQNQQYALARSTTQAAPARSTEIYAPARSVEQAAPARSTAQAAPALHEVAAESRSTGLVVRPEDQLRRTLA
jgi:hypothetical protein